VTPDLTTCEICDAAPASKVLVLDENTEIPVCSRCGAALHDDGLDLRDDKQDEP